MRPQPTPVTEREKDDLAWQVLSEANDALGLVTPSGAERLYPLLRYPLDVPLRKALAAHRRVGNLLNADEKRRANIRANAKFSDVAFAELTEQGQRCALQAHEITLLRAMNSLHRAIAVSQCKGSDFRIHGVSKDRCRYCSENDGKVLTYNNVPVLPPGECEVEDCPMMVSAQLNFISGLKDRLSPEELEAAREAIRKEENGL